MLDSIRQNSQSWGVKLAFALIVVVFVFWGVGSMNGPSNSAVMATVNDTAIMMPEFKRAYELQMSAIKARFPGIDESQFKQLRMGQQVLQGLIARTLLLQEAERLGMTVTPVELKTEIASIPLFQNAQGEFDPEVYKQMLAAQGMSAGSFERQFKEDLLTKKVRENAAISASVSDEEAREAFVYASEKRSMDYLMYSAVDFFNKATVTDDEIKAFYDTNIDRYAVPAQVTIKYLAITPEGLASTVTVDEAEAEAYYADNKEAFRKDEQADASHILVKLDENASEEAVAAATKKIEKVLKLARSGKDFGELAKEYSEGPSAPTGGALGTFTRGQMVKPFEDAVFSMKDGEISEPVRTRFGLHIIKLNKLEEARTPAFEEVKGQIMTKLAEDKGADKVTATLDAAMEQMLSGKSLEDIAKEQNLTLVTSPEFSLEQAPVAVGVTKEAAEELFAVPAGTTVDTPLEAKNGYIVARVETSKPESSMPLEQVAASIKEQLVADKSVELAFEAAKAASANVLADKLDGQPKVETTPLVDRQGFIPGIGAVQEVAKAVFEADGKKWMGPYKTPSGAVFVRLDKVDQPSEKVWLEAKDEVHKALLQRKKQQMEQSFVKSLADKAEIIIKNQEILDKL
ncbi:peptidylprolyl isomerase [Halodesulfovibrio marinisediminis]|uniref:Periplasmic chaperone PpiD n=1 Tax=Halodesulfovibrio marinisediminis DSM 17456 TaxID=1121457 RepID=A0A1N6IWA0_9BACT|nr:peptidylprolyl isomerase [Halodesulfovibrio marinisediminis]SIO36313.1 peptidyl-prolyl cis-trans isomerase D [Halodesulfovibrio marinisediminis DSM 17456]